MFFILVTVVAVLLFLSIAMWKETMGCFAKLLDTLGICSAHVATAKHKVGKAARLSVKHIKHKGSDLAKRVRRGSSVDERPPDEEPVDEEDDAERVEHAFEFM